MDEIKNEGEAPVEGTEKTTPETPATEGDAEVKEEEKTDEASA